MKLYRQVSLISGIGNVKVKKVKMGVSGQRHAPAALVLKFITKTISRHRSIADYYVKNFRAFSQLLHAKSGIVAILIGQGRFLLQPSQFIIHNHLPI
jgi:hypothetical protein